MKLKVLSIIFLGYIVAIFVVSAGNTVGERYKLYVTKEILSPIVDANDLGDMNRYEIYELISQPEFMKKYRENMKSYKNDMILFSASSFSVQFILLLALAGISTSIINRFYVAKS